MVGDNVTFKLCQWVADTGGGTQAATHHRFSSNSSYVEKQFHTIVLLPHQQNLDPPLNCVNWLYELLKIK